MIRGRRDEEVLPQLPEAQLVTSEVPARGDWLYEVKFDG